MKTIKQWLDTVIEPYRSRLIQMARANNLYDYMAQYSTLEVACLSTMVINDESRFICENYNFYSIEFLNGLEEVLRAEGLQDDVITSFRCNYDPKYLIPRHDGQDLTKASDVIMCSFAWMLTCEGDPYWDLLYQQLIGIKERSPDYFKMEIKATVIRKPTLEFLLSLEHGQEVMVSIDNCEPVHAIINANEQRRGLPAIFFCQDKLHGTNCQDLMGKKYSWVVCDRHTELQITSIELINKNENKDENQFIMKTQLKQSIGGLEICLTMSGKHYLKRNTIELNCGKFKGERVRKGLAKKLYTRKGEPQNYCHTHEAQEYFSTSTGQINKELIDRYDMIIPYDKRATYFEKALCIELVISATKTAEGITKKEVRYFSPDYSGYYTSRKYNMSFILGFGMENIFEFCEEQKDYVLPEEVIIVLEGNDRAKQNADYHSLSRRSKVPEGYKGFTIGFEIEKEDSVQRKKYFKPIHEKTGWCKENDGSLSDSSGFEFISPVLPMSDTMLINDEIDQHIDIINADGSDKCGGHISVAHTGMNVWEVYNGVTQFFPLLYSMYKKRMDNTYSQADRERNYTASRDKKKAIYIKANVVEFRIFPLVENVRQLKWRYRLMKVMFKNYGCSEVEVLKMILNKKSGLYMILSEIYTDSQILEKASDYCKYAKQFNEVVIPEKIKIKFKN